MSGFLRIAVIGSYYGQQVVNTFAYRSSDWPWVGVGNPFGDVLKVLDDFWTNAGSELKAIHNPDFRIDRLEGVAYTDAYAVATPQPVVRTINSLGTNQTNGVNETSGASVCATLGFIMGAQSQIIGLAQSPRNRGYISLGPVPEIYVDNSGHLSAAYLSLVESLAEKLDDTLTDIPLTASFIPIRFHGKKEKNLLDDHFHWKYLTYADVIGYRLPAVASWRRSRMPEA